MFVNIQWIRRYFYRLTKKCKKPYDLDIPEYQLESLARVLLPIMQDYLASEEGQKDYEEWQKSQLNKQKNKEKEPH